MFEIRYYRDERGNYPAREFINNPQNGSIKANISAAIMALSLHGLTLIRTERLSFIGNRDDGGSRINGLYELRNVEKKWRIAVFHDMKDNNFILLYGFRKKKQHQPEDIIHAQRLAIEYVSRKEHGDAVTD